MVRLARLLFLGLLIASPIRAAVQSHAFVRVGVIPMDEEQVLHDQTVVIENGIITALGPSATTPVPDGAVRIEAMGQYLIPGLTDMHTHLLSDDRIADMHVPHELAVILANGVTTIRIPIGKPEHLAYRAHLIEGTLLGPRLYVAGPQIAGRRFGPVFHGRVVTTPTQARSAVRDIQAAGYDFVKLTLFITPEVHQAVMETAAEVGIPVFGHVGPQVGLEQAFAAGQQIEHLDEYLEALLPEGSTYPGSVSDINVYNVERWGSLDELDERRLPALAEAAAKAGIWNTPTLTFFRLAFGTGLSDTEIAANPDYRFVSPSVREELLRGRTYFWIENEPPQATRRARYVELRHRIVKALYDAGAPLMIGADAPEWLLLYGFTTHREMASFVMAGLSPYAALEAATKNPARYLGTLDTSGTIDVGKRADLVLLDANPLEDIRHTEAIAGVMVRGRWLDRATLDQMLDDAAAALTRAPLLTH